MSLGPEGVVGRGLMTTTSSTFSTLSTAQSLGPGVSKGKAEFHLLFKAFKSSHWL